MVLTQNERNRRYREKHREASRLNAKKSLNAFIARHPNYFKEYNQKYYHKNKDKHFARNQARKIKIPDKQICQICNMALATQKHHPDYSKPLDVIFTCARCNMGEKFLYQETYGRPQINLK